ncbi:MAG: hypothetical protein Q8L02_05820 [Candidatus Nitrotoga sp.]|nr:hypothetical protein [Candidatus Nitrotoga sp.]
MRRALFSIRLLAMLSWLFHPNTLEVPFKHSKVLWLIIERVQGKNGVSFNPIDLTRTEECPR